MEQLPVIDRGGVASVGGNGGGPSSDDVNSSFWARGVLSREYLNRSLRPVEVTLLVRYNEELSGSVLEAGCGAGRVIGHLTTTSAHAHGIDISARMVEYCRQKYPDGTFELADVRDVDGLDSVPFDVILATCNLLDVLGDGARRACLDALQRAISPGGLLIMSSHNRACIPKLKEPVARTRDFVRSRDWHRLAASLPRLPKQIWHHRRLRHYAMDLPGYAILNDSAHDYSLLQYYMWREDQERQLAEHGFEVLECLDLDGSTVPPGDDAEDCIELHYVARRTA